MKNSRKMVAKILILTMIMSLMGGLFNVKSAETIGNNAIIAMVSDIADILDHSLIMAANSPIYITKGTVKEYSSYPKALGEDILVCADIVATELQTLNDAGVEYVSADYFAQKGFQVYKSTSFQFVIIGNQYAMTPELEERIIKLFGTYVSQSGNDANSGYPNSPVATFEKATTLFRQYKTTYGDGFRNTVYLHAGIYRRSSSIVLTAADNGMNIQAFGDGEVSFRGSVNLPKEGFTQTQDATILSKLPREAVGKVYQINLKTYTGQTTAYPEYAVQTSSSAYYELYVKSSEQTLARWPNKTWALTGSPLADKKSFKLDNTRSFRWADSASSMLFGYWTQNYACQPIHIDTVDEVNGVLTLTKAPSYGLSSNDRYYAFNMLEELDVPGEWYIDNVSNILYYYPTDEFSENSIELTTLAYTIFRLDGGVKDIKIKGINVELSRGHGIFINGKSDNINISNCNIRNVGNVGIALEQATNSIVNSCNIYNIGGTGVNMWGGSRLALIPANSRVENCNIYNFGRIFRTYQPGINVEGTGNTISHNNIHDSPHVAIKFNSNDNVIEYNEIYNVVKETSDSGAIYTSRNWTTLGNVIRYNYFHDIKKDPSLLSFMTQAVYIDDMVGGTQVTSNVFENCTQVALFGGGRNNTFKDNVLIDCDNSIYYDARAKVGGWAHSSTLPGGTVYEGLMSIINKIGYSASLWEGKYAGLAELVSDATRQANGEPVDAGLPKNVMITNNYSYGAATGGAGYESISQSVIDNGTVNGNIKTTSEHTVQNGYGNIPFDEIGMETTPVWDSNVHLVYPRNNLSIDGTMVELAWNKTGGAEKYRIRFSKNSDMSSPLFDQVLTATNYTINNLELGKYYWCVQAINEISGVGQSETYNFEVMKNTSVLALVAAINDATILIGSKTVGAAIGNVPQGAKDAFQSEITIATVISTDATATQEEADAQIIALATATTNFNNAVIVVVTAETVAAGITSVVAPAKDATSLTLPIVPDGYTIAIKSATSTIATIALNGTIAPPTEGTTVAVVFKVTKTSDNMAADTARINVIVPAKTNSSETLGIPGKPVLADDNGQDTSLKGGTYNITMNLWWGENGTQYKLYEDGVLIDAKSLTPSSPSVQTAVTLISGKLNGIHKYYCELINDNSTTTSDIITVNVTDAFPGIPVLSNDNWDGDGNYKVDTNMWWGTNGKVYKLYENGVLIDTQSLEEKTPQAQVAVTSISGRELGTYNYYCEFINDSGVTTSNTMTIKVIK